MSRESGQVGRLGEVHPNCRCTVTVLHAKCPMGHAYEYGKPCPICALAPSMADDAVQCPTHRIWHGLNEKCPFCQGTFT